MNKVKILITVLFGILQTFGVIGQISISSDEFLPDLEVCGNAASLSITLLPESDISETVNVSIDFPPGGEYLDNSLEAVLPTGLELGNTIVGTESVSIEILVDGIWTSDAPIEISIDRIINCAAIEYAQSGGTFEDEITVEVAGETTFQNGAPYGVLFGVIDVNILEGDFIEIEVSNGGLGNIQDFNGTLDLPSFWSFTGLETNLGNLSFTEDENIVSYEVTGAVLGNGEAALLTLEYEEVIDNCGENAAVLEAVVNWGCTDEICGDNVDNSDFSVQTVVFTDNDSELSTELIQESLACNAIIHEHIYSNTHPTADVFDLEVLIESNSSNGFIFANQNLQPVLSEVEIQGLSVPFSEEQGTNSYFYVLDFSENTTPYGNLADLDNDGFIDDLPANTSLNFTTYLEVACPQGGYLEHSGFQLDLEVTVENECEEIFDIESFNPLFGSSFDGIQAVGDVDFWSDEQDYAMGFCFDWGISGFECPTDATTLEIILPSGFYLSETQSNVLIEMGSYEEASQTGNVVTITGIQKSSSCILVLFNFVCEAGSDYYSPIEWNVSYECDEDCDCVWSLGEHGFNVFVHQEEAEACLGFSDEEPLTDFEFCEGVCLMTLDMNAERVNYGATDYSFTEIVEPIDSIHAKNIALFCDSIVVHSDAIVIGEGTIQEPRIRITHTQAADAHLLEWLIGTVEFYDAETGNAFACEIPLELVDYGSWDTLFYADLDLTEALNNCAMGFLTEGDSVNFEGYFKVAITDTTVGFNSIDLHQFRAIHNFVSNDNVTCACDNVGQRFYIRDINVPYQATNNFFGDLCEGLEVFTHLKPQEPTPDIFPEEIRPTVFVDSIVVNLPAGMEYQVGSSRYRDLPNPLGLVPINEPIITVTAEGANVLTYINDGTWPLGEAINDTGPTLVFNIVGTTCSVTDPFEVTFYFTENAFGAEGCEISRSAFRSTPFQLFQQQGIDFELTQSDNVEDFVNRSDLVYDFQYCNQSSTNFVNVFAMTNSEFLEPVETSMGNLVSIDGEVFLIELGDLAEDECVDFQVRFAYTSCNEMPTLAVDVGWQCGAYPTVWDEYGCNTLVTFNEYLVPPNNSEIQLDVSGPEAAVQLCDTIQYEILLNSAQEANLINPEVILDLPEAGGFALVGMPMIEYPLGTALRPFTTNVVSNQIVVNLAEANAENPNANFVDIETDGLKGVQLGTNETRQAKIYLSFVTDCNFVAGSQFLVSVFGDRICNEPAIGSGSAQLVEPVNIQGVAADHLMQLSIESDTLFNCSNSHDIEVSLNNIGPSSAEAGTVLTAFVPIGFHFQSLDNNANNIEFIEETPLSASNQLKFVLNEGLAVDTEVAFVMSLSIDQNEFCTENTYFDLQIQTVQTISADCVATGEECDLQVQTNINGFFEIPLQSPKVELSAQNTIINCGNDQLSEINFVVENTGNAELADLLTVEIYEDVNDNGPDEDDVLIASSEFAETNLVAGASEVFTMGLPALNEWDNMPIYIIANSANLCWDCQSVIQTITDYEIVAEQDLSGTIWLDTDGDGLIGSSEMSLANIPITLQNTSNGSIQTGLTNEDGAFIFEDLALGEWQIDIDQIVLPDFVPLDEDISINLELSDCGDIYEQNIPLSQECNISFEPTPICLTTDTYNVNVFTATGIPPFTFTGDVDTVVNSFDFNVVGPTIPVTESYSVLITDAQGCTTTVEGDFDCSTLGYQEVHFECVALNDGNHLSWDIPTNPDRKHLLLERSWENKPFELVVTLPSNKLEYLDEFAPSGTCLYRLVEVAFSGAVEVLAYTVVYRNNTGKELMHISPNPTQNQVNVSVNSNVQKQFLLKLIDINGQVLLAKNEHLTSGLNSFTIDLSQYASGIYFLSVLSKDSHSVERIIKW